MSDFFPETQALTGHNFAASKAIVICSSSFESPKPYLLTLYIKNSIAALLKSVRIC